MEFGFEWDSDQVAPKFEHLFLLRLVLGCFCYIGQEILLYIPCTEHVCQPLCYQPSVPQECAMSVDEWFGDGEL